MLGDKLLRSEGLGLVSQSPGLQTFFRLNCFAVKELKLRFKV